MKNQAGFTLIELVIVVAIVGILTAIVLPSYQDSVRKSRRSDAQGALLELANFMERFYTEQSCYIDPGVDTICGNADDGGAPGLPFAQSPKTGTAYYNLSLSAATGSSYTLQAVPAGDQAADLCGTMTLDQAGTRTKTGSLAGCW